MELKEILIQKLKRIGVFKHVQFMMLYGSQADGTARPTSDIDICISLSLLKKERAQIRLKLLSDLPSTYDVQIFEDLPLRVKIGVLKGKILFCSDKDNLIEQALQIKKAHEDFLPRYQYYIMGEDHAETAYL